MDARTAAVVALAWALSHVLLAPVAGYYHALAGHQIWEVQDAAEAVARLRQDGVVDVLHGSSELQQLRVAPENVRQARAALAPLVPSVVVSDLALHLHELERRRVKRSAMDHHQHQCDAHSCPKPLTDKYMTLTQMEYYLKELARSSPRVELTSIGKSIEDRDIWMVRVKPDDKVNREKEGTRSVWIEAGIHAREWIAPAVALYLLDRLVHEPEVTQALDVYMVPMANPDGYEYTWSVDRLWRKNRRTIFRSDCKGTDLNRNWGSHWSKIGSSENPCSEVYQGFSAFSEPETKALSDKMKEVSATGNLDLMLSLHSYGQDILYPYGWSPDPAPDTNDMQAAGRAFADGIKESGGKDYSVVNSYSNLYPASGATDDYAKEILNVKYSFTVELRPTSSPGFLLPNNQIEGTCKEIWNGFKKMLPVILKEK